MINQALFSFIMNYTPESSPLLPTNDIEAMSIAGFWVGNNMAFIKHSAVGMSESMLNVGTANIQAPKGSEERPFTWGDFRFGFSSEANDLSQAINDQTKRFANGWRRLEDEMFFGPRNIPQQVRHSMKRVMSIEEEAYLAYVKSRSVMETYNRVTNKKPAWRIDTLSAKDVTLKGKGKAKNKKRITLPTL